MDDVEQQTFQTASDKPRNLRDKVKLLVQELETNIVDSPHLFGWLHLRIKDLTLEECEVIADALKLNNDNVKWLDIAPINISADGLAFIIDSLKTNVNISILHLHGKPDNDLFGEEDNDDYLIPVPAQSLMKVLQINTLLGELMIGNSLIDDSDMKMIIDGLQMNSTLTRFTLEDNPKLTVESAHYLSELIQSSRTLEKLVLSGKCIVNDPWAIIIAQAMKNNQSIKELFMIHGEIGDEGARSWGELLVVDQMLIRLGLSGNHITDEGADALAYGLKQNSTLQNLSLNANGFTKASSGGEALLAAKSEELKYLFLD